MATRFICKICRNEIAHPGAECPYCRGRSVIAEGASPRILAMVFGVMVAIFTVTGFYARSFKLEGQDRGRLHFEAARAEMADERYEEAISLFRDALLYSRDNSAYRLELSRALYAAGRYSETENYLSGLRTADPASGIVNLLLARLAARGGQVTEAVSYYRTAIHGHWDTKPEVDRIDMHLELVDLLDREGLDQQLAAELLELAEIAPDDTEILRRLAILLLKTGSYDRASSIFRSLLVSAPTDRELLLGRAAAEFQLGNYLTARTHYNRAQLYGDDDETRERIRLCNRIIELDPTRRGIGLGERLRRSRLLIERTLTAFSACRNPAGSGLVGPLPLLPQDETLVIDRAESVLDARRQRATDASVESNILLAEEVWNFARARCDSAGPPDRPLLHVLAKLSR